ncbi:unnamed protein product [Coregonus sp. 'balchen']|nr:unnamed protein product [Coregonus sp. 'balchen']
MTGLTLLLSEIKAHLTNLFENDKHFSHLSSIEKEMAFRTEMGLYYSYFKVFINAPSFLHGLRLIMNDRFSEYPLVINALKRFNLYPEVFLGSLFRIYTGTMDFFGIPTKACWNVTRADGLNPVESCEGMGDAAYFYVSCVFLLNGWQSSWRCRHRPVSLLQPWREHSGHVDSTAEGELLLSLLCPADAAVNIYSQVACLFACYFMGYLSTAKMKSLLVVHLTSFAICFVLLFGNLALFTSFYISSLVAGWVSRLGNRLQCLNTQVSFCHTSFLYGGVFQAIIALRDDITRVCKPGIVTILVQGIAWFTSTVLLKFFMSFILGVSNDAHIGNLIRSKLTNYKDFHTLMCTCAAEFDFMELETLLGYVKTLILPVNIVIVGIISGKAIKEVWRSLRREIIYSKEDIDIDTEQPAQFANGEGVANYQSQRGIVGDFSNLPQEQLLEWINANTMPNAVFAGSMPTMASVKLSTGRVIVNHPHYEDTWQRERTKLVYTMYSRKPAKEVKRNLMQLQADYFILEDSWCNRRSRPGCSMPEIWDVEDQENRGKLPLCTLLSIDSRPHFTTMFQNKVYKVLKIPKDAK